ncbi:MAG: ABC transporter permease, partial [Clostridiales bacterium]
MNHLLITILTEACIFGIMSLGVYITYKILDFPDLTVDGSFPLGAAITAVLIINGVNPWLCTVISFMAGLAAGTITGILNVKLKIKNLLSGILVMTALYTVNLRIAGGKSNLPIFEYDNIFSLAPASFLPFGKALNVMIICFVLIAVIKLLLDWYLSTR